MKRILIISILACACNMLQAQEALFKQFSGQKGVETVYVSKTMLSLIPKSTFGNKDISQIAGNIDQIRVFSCENKQLIPQIKTEAEAYYTKEKYEVVMENKEDDEHTTIYIKKIGKKKNEFIVFQTEKNELEIISITGNITIDDLKKLEM